MEELIQIPAGRIPIETSMELSLNDERSLVEQAKSDPLAFGKLFNRYHDRIFNYILHRTANVSLAQELTSDTFYKAMKKLWTFRWKNIPFSAWLYRIASNETNGYFRKHKHIQSVPIDNYIETLPDELNEANREIHEAEKQIAKETLYLKLHSCIASLKPKYQDVIVLRYFENKRIRDISQITGKSEGTIKSLLHRAIRQLRSKLNTSSL